MSYGGESNAKKAARVIAWNTLLSYAGRRKNPEDFRALVLAGPVAGDIRTLRAFGVPSKNITAVDTDPAAIESSRLIAPNANYVLGDVLKVASRRRRRRPPLKYDVIFLDYCSPISERAIQKSVRVAKAALVNGGAFCTGFMYGREGPGAREGVKFGREMTLLTKKVVEEGVIEPTPAMLRGVAQYGLTEADFHAMRNIDPDSLKGEMKRDFEKVMNKSSRILYLQNRVFVTSMDYGMVLFNTGSVTYRSGRRTTDGRSSGVPMLYFMSKGLQFLGHLPRRKLEQHYLRAVAEFDTDETFHCEDIHDDPDGTRLRRIAVEFARTRGSAYVAELFGFNPRTVAAWLAWDTMRARDQSPAA